MEVVRLARHSTSQWCIRVQRQRRAKGATGEHATGAPALGVRREHIWRRYAAYTVQYVLSSVMRDDEMQVIWDWIHRWDTGTVSFDFWSGTATHCNLQRREVLVFGDISRL